MALSNGLVPSKVIAVHLNYPSRAAQRGRVPRHASYFLKPPSSISGDGDPVVRPRGSELLTFEGEVAVVIGRQARDVAPDAALDHIGWYAPANDIGLADLRWADAGSNVLAKGHDGFTPIGPLAPAAEFAADGLTLTTRVNGELVQEAKTDELLFGFAQLVADLSRFITLEVGDVVLTGTPAGSGVLRPGDRVEVEIPGIGRVRNAVVESDAEPAPYGAMPRATAEAKAYALGASGPRPVVLSDAAHRALEQVSTATLTAQLRKRGVGNTFLGGLRASRPEQRMIGYAQTLRYVAYRADVRAALHGEDAQKRAVESVAPGEVLMIEARDVESAGTIGDILVARLLARGAAGVVTDGAVRDTPGVAAIELPAYYRSANAASLWFEHIPWQTGEPITCAGVLVMPGDVVVGDAEGVVIIPAALAEEVAHDAVDQESREAFALERVTAGESIRGLYPLSAERTADYEAWRAERET